MLNTTPLDARQAANASGWIREHRGILVNSRDIEFLRSLRSPSVSERAEKILVEFERRLGSLGASHSFDFSDTSQMTDWAGISWSADKSEVKYLIFNYLYQFLQAIDGRDTNVLPGGLLNTNISPKGHKYLQDLAKGNIESSIGFCAMWFRPSLDALWEQGIRPAIVEAGYDAIRIDKHEHNNKIDDEIIAMVRRSRFVVADFTGNRGGVYFEAGYAMGQGVPVLWTVREKRYDRIHFDNRQYNFLGWSPEDYDGFRSRLKSRIEATIGQGPKIALPRTR